MSKSKSVTATVTAANYETFRFAASNTPVATGATAVLRFSPGMERPTLHFEDDNPRMIGFGVTPMMMSPQEMKTAKSAIYPLTNRRIEKNNPELKAEKKAFILSSFGQLPDDGESVKHATSLLNLKKIFNKFSTRFNAFPQNDKTWETWLLPQATAIKVHVTECERLMTQEKKFSPLEKPNGVSQWLWNFFKNEEKSKKGSEFWDPPEPPQEDWDDWMFTGKKIQQSPYITVQEVLEGMAPPSHCAQFQTIANKLLTEMRGKWETDLKVDFKNPDKSAKVFYGTKLYLPPVDDKIYQDRDDKSLTYAEWFGAKDLDKGIKADPSLQDNMIALYTTMFLRNGVIPRSHYRGDKSTQILRVVLGPERHKALMDSKTLKLSDEIPRLREELGIVEMLVSVSHGGTGTVASIGRLLEKGDDVRQIRGFIASAGVSWSEERIAQFFPLVKTEVETAAKKTVVAPTPKGAEEVDLTGDDKNEGLGGPNESRASARGRSPTQWWGEITGFSIIKKTATELAQTRASYPKIFRVKPQKEKDELLNAIPPLGKSAAKALGHFGMTVEEMMTVISRAPSGTRPETALENAAWAASHAGGITRFSLADTEGDQKDLEFD